MTLKHRGFDREREVTQQSRLLEKLSSPRLIMSLMALLTAASGFFASWALLHMGLAQMWLRYPAAVVLAYLFFLFELWCWVRSSREDESDSVDAGLEVADAMPNMNLGSGNSVGSGNSGDSSLFDSADVGDGEGAIIGVVIVALLALAAAVFAAFSIITIAPVLLAELLVDAALAAGLYRHVRGLDRERHWLKTALARTAWRFGVVALIAGVVGALLAQWVPGAVSIGDVLH